MSIFLLLGYTSRMDELELSGRRHISAKRAAKEHRYHSDYIGQLIRGGKVAGQKVGRSWYVDAASLDAYLKGETAPAAGPSPAPVAEPVPAPVAPVVAPAPEPAVVVPEPEPVVAPAPAPVVAVARPVHIVREAPAPVAPKPVYVAEEKKVAPPAFGLQFVPDEAPLAPTRVMPAQAQHLVVDESGEVVAAPVRRGRGTMVGLAAVGACAFLLAFGASFFAVHKSTVAGSATSAAVHFGL